MRHLKKELEEKQFYPLTLYIEPIISKMFQSIFVLLFTL